MGEILLIRHGETEWNRDQVFRGRADVPLSERGREQARLLAQSLKDARLDAIYSSPLSRARDTAAPLAALLGLEVIADERLVDMSFGEWEGRPQAEIEERQPELHRLWLERPDGFRAPGGESLGDIVARAWPAINEIAARHRDGRAAIVSHRVVCKLLLCCAVGAGPAGFWRLRVDSASVSALDAKGEQWVLTRTNDRQHLGALVTAGEADF